MDKYQEFHQKRAEIFAAMMGAMQAMSSPMPEDNTRQYINGYLSLIESALQGDLSARDDYLNVAIPPLKQHKVVTLGYSINILIVLNTTLLKSISAEIEPWYTSFFADYAEKLCDIWEAS